MIKDRCMRIDLTPVRRLILCDLPGLRIKFPDISTRNRRKPDIPVFISHEPMRPGPRRLQRILLELDRAFPACWLLAPCTRAPHPEPAQDHAAATLPSVLHIL